MKSKPYHVPDLCQAGRVFKQSTADFITEWLSYISNLANITTPTAIQKAELADCRKFLESVVRLGTTTEFASVGKDQRSEFASRAEELLQKIDGTVKAVTLSEILNLA